MTTEPRRLIDSSTLHTEVQISEDDLKARLQAEVLADLGLIDTDGQMLRGVSARTLRGDGGKGGYRVIITHQRSMTNPPRLEGPR